MIKSQQSTLVFSVIFLFFIHGLCAEVSTENYSNAVQDELIISFNFDECGEDEEIALVAGVGFLFVCTSLLLVASRSSKLFYLALLLEIAIGGGFATVFWVYKQSKNNTLVAIFNEQGVWDQNYGTIAWEDIEKVNIVQIPYSSTESIGITIKKTSLPTVKEQKDQEGKYSKFYDADSYGCHIFVPPMSVPLEKIISFAERFIE